MFLFLCPKYLPFDAYWHDESCPFPILGNLFFTYSPCFRSFFPLFFDIFFLHAAFVYAAIGITVVIAQIKHIFLSELFLFYLIDSLWSSLRCYPAFPNNFQYLCFFHTGKISICTSLCNRKSISQFL